MNEASKVREVVLSGAGSAESFSAKAKPRGAVVVLSGGMDSTTLLYFMLSKAKNLPVYALSVDYGQRHKRELSYARWTCESLGVKHQIVDLSNLTKIMKGSALTDTDNVAVPHGHYASESMKATVVPNRNMLLLSTAAAYAISMNANTIAYAAHAGDHTIYPDCRVGFTEAMARALRLAHFYPIRLIRPFVNINKTAIAVLGDLLNVDWERTWSCYEGGEVHCGQCGTCVERREAFREGFVEDPTEYRVADYPDQITI